MKRKFLQTILVLLIFVILSWPSFIGTRAQQFPDVHNPLRFKPASISTPGQPPYVPSDIRAGYNFLPLYAKGINGTGTRIAIIDAFGSSTLSSDLNSFDSLTGLPPATVNTFYPDGIPGRCHTQACTNWALETSLDVEWAHAIAPAATIDLVVSLDSSISHIYDAISYVANNLKGETVLSMSFGLSESQYPTTGGDTIAATHQLFAIMTSQGTTPFASSGDSGATTCCDPQYPASDPLVVAVGGTTLNLNSTAGLVSETTWSGSGAGSSTTFSKPAYQQGLGDTMRDDVDVSYDADQSTGFLVVRSGFTYQVGGTSAGSPQWAALIALASQANATRFGSILPQLYKLTTYHDITSGSDTFFSASTGWDYPTGLGTPDATGLVNSLAKSTDIALTTITASRNFAYSGVISKPITVNVTATNVGLGTQTFTVTLKANSTIVGTKIVTLAPSASPGSSMVLQFLWNASLLPRGSYLVTAQATTVPGEANTANNTILDSTLFANRLRGDINGDCRVNIIDLSTVGASFGTSPPTNINADINNDGQVNIIDDSSVGASFGINC